MAKTLVWIFSTSHQPSHRSSRQQKPSDQDNRTNKVIFSFDSLKRNSETINVKFKTRISTGYSSSILSGLGHNKNHQNMQTNILQRGSIKHREGGKSHFNTHKDLFSKVNYKQGQRILKTEAKILSKILFHVDDSG